MSHFNSKVNARVHVDLKKKKTLIIPMFTVLRKFMTQQYWKLQIKQKYNLEIPKPKSSFNA